MCRGKAGERLTDTGVVWSAADRVIALRDLGACGVVERALKCWGECVEDARVELRGWIDDEDLEGSDSELDEEDADQDFWDRPTRKGRLDEKTRGKAEEAVRKLKLVTILFGAARKRRLTGEGKLEGDVERVDRIAGAGKDISRLADDVGIAFYEGEDLEDVVSSFPPFVVTWGVLN